MSREGVINPRKLWTELFTVDFWEHEENLTFDNIKLRVEQVDGQWQLCYDNYYAAHPDKKDRFWPLQLALCPLDNTQHGVFIIESGHPIDFDVFSRNTKQPRHSIMQWCQAFEVYLAMKKAGIEILLKYPPSCHLFMYNFEWCRMYIEDAVGTIEEGQELICSACSKMHGFKHTSLDAVQSLCLLINKFGIPSNYGQQVDMWHMTICLNWTERSRCLIDLGVLCCTRQDVIDFFFDTKAPNPNIYLFVGYNPHAHYKRGLLPLLELFVREQSFVEALLCL